MNKEETPKKERLPFTFHPKCPYCHNEILEEPVMVACAQCKTYHHKPCWDASQGCSVFGCDGKMPLVVQMRTREESGGKRITARQLQVASLCAALAFGSIAYRILMYGHLEQTSLLFIGIPAGLACIMAFLPKAKSAMGAIMRTMTIALLLSAVLLGEGVICILMASPLYYGIGALVGWLKDREERRKQGLLRVVLLPVLLMSLEGVHTDLSFPRNETVIVERIVNLSTNEVEQSLSAPLKFTTPLPTYLKLGFPRPVSAYGSGLQPGNKRLVHFAGGEGRPGDLVIQVVEHTENHIVFALIEDRSKIAHWLAWQEAEVEWVAVDKGRSRVRWTLRYERLLDPSWYFGPWERYAVRLAGEYLMDNLIAENTKS